MTRTEIHNGQDVIDSRDVIERIEELEAELESIFEDATNEGGLDFDDWLKDGQEGSQDDIDEYLLLKALAEECEGYAPDWLHGATLINESYFEDYARELAEDVGDISKDTHWPATCIDWEQAANELKIDYTEVDFDGTAYYIR